jgi:DNA-binding LacI/PurR family transcriptional regulator
MPAKTSAKHAGGSAPAGRVSMQDVAVLTGLSRSAVSLALLGHPSIPDHTRERVHAAARRLGYRKHPLVAALMSSRRMHKPITAIHASLAFMTSDVPPDSWQQGVLLRAIHAAAVRRATDLGFSLMEFSAGDPDMRPERLSALLKARGIHGILVAPLPGEQTRLRFDTTNFAAVGLGMSVKEPAIDRVADDHFYETKLAFDQCLALGYRRIGLALPANVSRRLEHRWWSGFLVGQQQVAQSMRIPTLMPETREEIAPQLNAWIARHRVDVVVFSNRLEERMACAPSHVGLVSLSVRDASGRVAGIRQCEHGVGEKAIDLLVAKLNRWENGGSELPTLHLVRGTWSEGLSAPGAGKKRRALV